MDFQNWKGKRENIKSERSDNANEEALQLIFLFLPFQLIFSCQLNVLFFLTFSIYFNSLKYSVTLIKTFFSFVLSDGCPIARRRQRKRKSKKGDEKFNVYGVGGGGGDASEEHNYSDDKDSDDDDVMTNLMLGML